MTKKLNKILLLSSAFALTSCLPSLNNLFGKDEKKSSSSPTTTEGSSVKSEEEKEREAGAKIVLANFKTFPDSLISSMGLPSNALDSVSESFSTLHTDIDGYTEFNQNSMVKIAYVACDKFLENDPFQLDTNDSFYKNNMIDALIAHFMSHLDKESIPYQDLKRELLSLYGLNLHDNEETTSKLACAFAAANPYTTVSENLCETFEGSCEVTGVDDEEN